MKIIKIRNLNDIEWCEDFNDTNYTKVLINNNSDVVL